MIAGQRKQAAESGVNEAERWPPADSFPCCPLLFISLNCVALPQCFQHADVSRHLTVKLDIMQHSSGGETPAGSGHCERGLSVICLIVSDSKSYRLNPRISVHKGLKLCHTTNKFCGNKWNDIAGVGGKDRNSFHCSNTDNRPQHHYKLPIQTERVTWITKSSGALITEDLCVVKRIESSGTKRSHL